MVMSGVGEDDTKGRHDPLTTLIHFKHTVEQDLPSKITIFYLQISSNRLIIYGYAMLVYSIRVCL